MPILPPSCPPCLPAFSAFLPTCFYVCLPSCLSTFCPSLLSLFTSLPFYLFAYLPLCLSTFHSPSVHFFFHLTPNFSVTQNTFLPILFFIPYHSPNFVIFSCASWHSLEKSVVLHFNHNRIPSYPLSLYVLFSYFFVYWQAFLPTISFYYFN